METVAVIGTGIAGMAAAARLHPTCALTLYERNRYIGGHTNTVEVETPQGPLGIDTGFMVYNEATYPRLTRLFAELGVETIPTKMSFGVHHVPSGFCWSSTLAARWYGQWQTLRSARFWRMLREVVRFNRLAREALERGELSGSLADFLARHRFSQLFSDFYLLPMTGAIWSTPRDQMLAFPVETLFRFLSNHALLGLTSHHPWRTVKGGSRHYRERLIAPFRERIRTASAAARVERLPEGVQVTDLEGRTERFDRVVIATHADEALALLAAPSDLERRLLGSFRYSASDVVLHHDENVLPPRRAHWTAWSYRLDLDPEGHPQASTHYWMNQLQDLPGPQTHLVSLNAPEGLIRPTRVAWQTTYHHPTFDEAAWRAQSELPRLNHDRLFFAGSYFRYGFHEDALMAGQDAADALLAAQTQHAAPPLRAL
jgi:uncharacterized protein